MQFLNILVADDHPIFVEGLRAVLSQANGRLACQVSGVAHSGAQLADMLRQTAADLLLLDLNLPETDGLKILSFLKKDISDARVLVMALEDDPRLVRAAFKAGADGYMLKSGSKDELLRAIEEVIAGHTFVGRGVALSDHLPAHLPDETATESRFARKYNLTRREMEIMRYIGQALTNKEIAEKLYISDQTVSVHRKNIMRKLGVNSTANLIRIAFESHIV